MVPLKHLPALPSPLGGRSPTSMPDIQQGPKAWPPKRFLHFMESMYFHDKTNRATQFVMLRKKKTIK